MASASERGIPNPQEFWSRFVQPRVSHIQNVSPLNSTNLVKDARQTLDDELDVLHLAMCQLRKRRNALSLVSCLPPEILAHVFKFVANATPPQKWHSSRQVRLGWIGLTHVCTHWRDTALSHPSLWGNLDEGLTRPWRDTMIARAKSAPLSIHLPYYHLDDKAFLAKHAFHMREFRLSAPHDELQAICQTLTSRAPILKDLHLQGSGNLTFLPADIFAGDTPLLRHVSLYGVLFPWSAPIFHDLTDLRVELPSTPGMPADATISHESSPTSQHDHLLAALARMPALKTLHLARCLPSRSCSHHPQGHILVVFPHLELLFLEGTLIECMGIAQHLRISSSSRIVLECPRDSQETDPGGLIRFLETHVNMGTIPPLLTLSISLFAYRGLLSVELWHTRSPANADWPKFSPNREPLLSISFPPTPNSWDLVTGICKVLPLEDLRVLKVAYKHNNWTPEAWISLFGRCRLVEHVLVTGWNVVHFCRALTHPASGAGETVAAAEDLFFRHLKSLEVRNIDLLSDVKVDGLTQSVHMVLDDSLFTRADIIEHDGEEDSENEGQGGSMWQISEDSKLERLRISECSVIEGYVDDLNGNVRQVSWDGYEGVYKEESEEEEEAYDYYDIY